MFAKGWAFTSAPPKPSSFLDTVYEILAAGQDTCTARGFLSLTASLDVAKLLNCGGVHDGPHYEDQLTYAYRYFGGVHSAVGLDSAAYTRYIDAVPQDQKDKLDECIAELEQTGHTGRTGRRLSESEVMPKLLHTPVPLILLSLCLRVVCLRSRSACDCLSVWGVCLEPDTT